MSKPNLLAIWAKRERGEGATNEELGHLIDRFESLHDHAEKAEATIQCVRELVESNRATKHESTMYLHPLEILRALDGEKG
ncbi:hypothetical protein ACT3R5_04825 [Glutamicibacter sp. AOP5-A2-7]